MSVRLVNIFYCLAYHWTVIDEWQVNDRSWCLCQRFFFFLKIQHTSHIWCIKCHKLMRYSLTKFYNIIPQFSSDLLNYGLHYKFKWQSAIIFTLSFKLLFYPCIDKLYFYCTITKEWNNNKILHNQIFNVQNLKVIGFNQI